MNIGTKVPVQLNFVDYCTDEVMYTSYFVVEVDKFSVVNIPCTYNPTPCNELPETMQANCAEFQQLWTDPSGSYRCALKGGFYDRIIAPKICNASNFGVRVANTTEYIYKEGKHPISIMPATTGSCRCNRTTAAARTAAGQNITGVPDDFIKDGMSTFYTQLVIGGRKTSDPEPSCQCTSMDDTSAPCMCMLGTKKVQ